MRTVTTISLPSAVAKEVKKEAKEQGFTSTSEFMRHVLRQYKSEKLFVGLRKQQAAYRKNPKSFKVLRSLKELR
ncbi:MAG: ribbon-helix-helix domain-containing protein [Bryobacteraceae bacterium]